MGGGEGNESGGHKRRKEGRPDSGKHKKEKKHKKHRRRSSRSSDGKGSGSQAGGSGDEQWVEVSQHQIVTSPAAANRDSRSSDTLSVSATSAPKASPSPARAITATAAAVPASVPTAQEVAAMRRRVGLAATSIKTPAQHEKVCGFALTRPQNLSPRRLFLQIFAGGPVCNDAYTGVGGRSAIFDWPAKILPALSSSPYDSTVFPGTGIVAPQAGCTVYLLYCVFVE